MRIRSIKPEFFTHEGLYEAERETKLPLRVAFAGLWCAADREGRFKWEPRRLKAAILPYDSVDFTKLLNALERSGFIVRYGPDLEFASIPSFLSHQCINVREAKSQLPAAPSDACANTCKTVTREVQDFHGVNVPDSVRETVFARDGRKCLRCAAIDDLTVDHIFPQSLGGTHAITNLRTLCRACNSARPVHGQALIDDLKKDGLTLDDMQRTCMHVTREVHARGEGKGREEEGKGMEQGVADASDFEPMLPTQLQTDSFRTAWTGYVAYRKRMKFNALLPESVTKQFERFATFGSGIAVAAINASIANGWQGLFPEKINGSAKPATAIKEHIKANIIHPPDDIPA